MQTPLATLTTLATYSKSMGDQPKISHPKGSQKLSTCSLNNTFFHHKNNECWQLIPPTTEIIGRKTNVDWPFSVYNNITGITEIPQKKALIVSPSINKPYCTSRSQCCHSNHIPNQSCPRIVAIFGRILTALFNFPPLVVTVFRLFSVKN